MTGYTEDDFFGKYFEEETRQQRVEARERMLSEFNAIFGVTPDNYDWELDDNSPGGYRFVKKEHTTHE